MPESIVQWRKENLRYGLVQMHSDLSTHLKKFDRLRKKNLGLLVVDNLCSRQSSLYFRFPFISFGATSDSKQTRLVDEFPYRLYLSATQRSHIVRRRRNIFSLLDISNLFSLI